MACPRNALGQPACFITAHPSRPEHKFCVTCYQQFPGPTQSRRSRKTTPKLLQWTIIILTVMVIIKAMQIQPTPVSQPVYRFQTLESLPTDG